MSGVQRALGSRWFAWLLFLVVYIGLLAIALTPLGTTNSSGVDQIFGGEHSEANSAGI